MASKSNMRLELSMILSKTNILRLALGGMLLIMGILKLQTGTAKFVELASPSFTSTMLPDGLVTGFLTIVPTVETVVGALIVLGLFTSAAARVAGLMFALYIIALTSQNNPQAGVLIIGLFIYIFASFKLVCCSHSPISLDHLFRCKGGKCTM